MLSSLPKLLRTLCAVFRTGLLTLCYASRIKRAAYDTSAFTLTDATYVYTGEKYALGAEVNGKIPSDLHENYQIKMVQNGKGEAVTAEYESGNSAVKAGVYFVKAIFTIESKNAANYEPIPCEIEGTLTILPAEYDSQMQKLYLDSQLQEYAPNGEYKVCLSGVLPEGVIPVFTVTNVAGEEIVGTMKNVSSDGGNVAVIKPLYEYVFTVEEEGHYACVVTFTHNNENYKDVQVSLEGWIFIGSNP